MAKYTIVYRGWTTAEVEASNIDEAQEKFYDEGLNGLYDSEIDDIQLTDAIKVDPAYSEYYLGWGDALSMAQNGSINIMETRQ